MAVIAIEEHWTTPELAAALRELPPAAQDDSLVLNDHGDTGARLEDIGEARIAAMDAQGVDVQVLSLAPPATGPLAPADAAPLTRDLNDLAAAAVARHPSRLRAFAALPMSAPAEAAAELERAVGLGFVGAMVYGRTGERALDDPAYDDVFAAAEALAVPIFLHPQIASRTVREAAYSGFDADIELALATFGWGWHLEAALAALRLIVAGTFERHPRLQLILGHWGELLPFFSERTDSLARVAGLGRSVSEVVRENVHLTASGMLSPALLHHALEVTTADRLLYSTDYPFQRPTADALGAFLGEFTSEEDRSAFTEGNARRLLRITA